MYISICIVVQFEKKNVKEKGSLSLCTYQKKRILGMLFHLLKIRYVDYSFLILHKNGN